MRFHFVCGLVPFSGFAALFVYHAQWWASLFILVFLLLDSLPFCVLVTWNSWARQVATEEMFRAKDE